jgi:hypothetical protein
MESRKETIGLNQGRQPFSRSKAFELSIIAPVGLRRQACIGPSYILLALRDFVWVIFGRFHNSGKLQVRILSRR